MLVAISDIRVGKRLRSLRENAVADLMSSISELGLQTPISVKPAIAKGENGGDKAACDLIAGRHRLEACKRLGWEEIDASISQLSDTECELWEIDENLRRSEQLERGEHLLKRKALYEQLHPQARATAGSELAQKRWGDAEANLAPAFVSDAAKKTGASETAIKRSLRRAKKIDAKVRARIRDNPEIANSGVELDALASLDAQQQKQAVKMVEAGKAKTVREVRTKIASLAPKPPNAPSKESQIRAMRESAAPTRPYYGSSDQERDTTADELVQVLAAEIEQILKVLIADPSSVAQIARAKRVALAVSFLKLLDIGIDDLPPKIGDTASLTRTVKAPGAGAVPCDRSAVPEAIKGARSPPGGLDASDAPRHRVATDPDPIQSASSLVHTSLMAAYLAIPAYQAKVKDWTTRGDRLGEPAPTADDGSTLPFEALWRNAGTEAHNEFRRDLLVREKARRAA